MSRLFTNVIYITIHVCLYIFVSCFVVSEENKSSEQKEHQTSRIVVCSFRLTFKGLQMNVYIYVYIYMYTCVCTQNKQTCENCIYINLYKGVHMHLIYICIYIYSCIYIVIAEFLCPAGPCFGSTTSVTPQKVL